MRTDEAAKPLKPIYTKAFEFSDCWVNDARLVVLNARDAADRGATIVTRAAVTSARKEDGVWARRGAARLGRNRNRARKAARQRLRPLGRPGALRHARAEPRRQRPAGPGQPHRRQAALRARPLLLLPERRRADHVRDPLRGRVLADRHHRPRLRGRPRRREDQRERDRLPPRFVERVFREAGDPRRHRLDLFRRASALRRRRQQGAGSDARLRHQDQRQEGRRAAGQRHRRQAHDLSPARRVGARKGRGPDRQEGSQVDRDRNAPGRRFPAHRLRRCGRPR